MYCQKCRTPLSLDGSLQDLNSAAFHLLADASVTSQPATGQKVTRLYTPAQKQLYDQAIQNAQGPIFKKSVSTPGGDSKAGDSGVDGASQPVRDHSSMSFVNITESQVISPAAAQKANPQSPQSRRSRSSQKKDARHDISRKDENLLSNKMELSTRLFEILSSRSDIDHPVCAECTELLIEGMEKQLASVTKERDAFIDFLKEAQADVPTEEEARHAQQELDEVQEQEAQAMAELEALEVEKAALEREVTTLDEESLELDREEEQLWCERNAFTEELSAFQDEKESLENRLDHDSQLLERLRRSNVYNDTFAISHDGTFATINSLRLGRMSSATVEWSEINAAWGQTCLLLATVADKLSYKFNGYRLKPLGSTSTVEKIELMPRGSTRDGLGSTGEKPVTSFSLFYSSDFPLSLAILHRSFDNAMIAFLECVRQLGKHVERNTQDHPLGEGKGLKLPYEIRKDKIHDCSIKLPGFGGEEESWTKACKYTLTCCKFLLAHASNVNASREGGIEQPRKDPDQT